MNQAPVFCDECASLALAFLDDAPLCAKCLQKALNNGDSRMVQKIEPLVLSAEPITPLQACISPETAD